MQSAKYGYRKNKLFFKDGDIGVYSPVSPNPEKPQGLVIIWLFICFAVN